MPELIHIEEPTLLFRHDQGLLDPRDGLSLFGPLDKARPEGIRWAAVGPRESIDRLKKWVKKIQSPVVSGKNLVARPFFPGFEAAFHARWNSDPVIELEIPEIELRRSSFNADKHQRVYGTVSVYARLIQNALRTEDVSPDVWCVVIPEYVYQNCRPQSNVTAGSRIAPTVPMSLKAAQQVDDRPFLFHEMNETAEQYLYEVNFHHQLKARLLKFQVPTQIVRETTIAHRDFRDNFGQPTRSLDEMESSIAWTISTAMFYKAGGRPWKLGAARDGVCYIGLVFKQDLRARDWRTACCAAQMFLDSGDGVVFKGAVGPWYYGKRGHFHLNRAAAREVVSMCVAAYAERNNGNPPKELFLHGRISFNDEEWAGFQDGAGKHTKVVGVRIAEAAWLKLFRLGDHPVLRGLAYLESSTRALLWTRGMVPRLRTYPGREVPNPILVDVCRGDAEIRTVLSDILALTKLNYNACNYGDGLPVTLKFANAVGEILTAGPAKELVNPPLPFKYYI